MISMNTPIGETPIDRPSGLLGRPLDRVDGPLKVTGHAPYAYEYRDIGPAAYAFLLEAGIATGRLTAVDTSAAEKAPGVILTLTHKNAPKQGPKTENSAPQLIDDKILHYGQPIALVVAETFEQARAAARLIKPTYAAKKGAYDMASAMPEAFVPKPRNGNQPDSRMGDVDEAFAAAPVKIDVTYTTPPQSHAMMEPHATIAVWNDDALTLYTANHMLPRGVATVASTLQIPKEKVRLISRYVGGGFGAKLAVEPDAILAALAARMVNRPVKLALTRQQVFHVTTHRTDTIQRLRLAAQRDGTLTAIEHRS
jgi:xanthine dehydrogenase YagR molybdenum-binding subunit